MCSYSGYSDPGGIGELIKIVLRLQRLGVCKCAVKFIEQCFKNLGLQFIPLLDKSGSRHTFISIGEVVVNLGVKGVALHIKK